MGNPIVCGFQAIDWVFLAEIGEKEIRVLGGILAELGILPEMIPGKFVDLLELLDCLFDDFRIVIWV